MKTHPCNWGLSGKLNNLIILNITPKLRSKTFPNRSKAGYHSYLSCPYGLEAAVGKFLSDFEAKIFYCATFTSCNCFGGNKTQIMRISVNHNTLKLSLLDTLKLDLICTGGGPKSPPERF